MDNELLWCCDQWLQQKLLCCYLLGIWWGGYVTMLVNGYVTMLVNSYVTMLVNCYYVTDACELLMFGGYGWPAGSNLPTRVWVWGNSPTHQCIWGYPWCYIVVTGMGLGSSYPMGIYPLPTLLKTQLKSRWSMLLDYLLRRWNHRPCHFRNKKKITRRRPCRRLPAVAASGPFTIIPSKKGPAQGGTDGAVKRPI